MYKSLLISDIDAARSQIDNPDVVELAKADLSLQWALEASRPPNWWGTGASHDLLHAARADGIPLFGVPRASIIMELNAVRSGRAERIEILRNRWDEVLDDCEEVLDRCDLESLDDNVALTRASLSAVRGGHHEAGMALAVALGEPLAEWAATPRVNYFDSRQERATYDAKRKGQSKYKWAAFESGRARVDSATGQIHDFDLPYQVLIAPLPKFFTEFYARPGEIAPVELSRHVVAHQATVKHFTRENALLAVMLVCSILTAQQAWGEAVERDDAMGLEG